MKAFDVIQLKKEHLARLANENGSSGESIAIEAMSNWIPRPKGKDLRSLLSVLNEAGIQIKGSSQRLKL